MKSQFAKNRAARWMARVQQWQWRESGLAKTRYCRENGLALSTFQYWITKSRPSSGGESAAIPALVVSLPSRSIRKWFYGTTRFSSTHQFPQGLQRPGTAQVIPAGIQVKMPEVLL
jgi:hypothetical protein